MICTNSGDLVVAELGNLVLERSDDLGLEGPCVGGQSGLSMQRCLGSLLNLGPHFSLHIKVLGEVNGWLWSQQICFLDSLVVLILMVSTFLMSLDKAWSVVFAAVSTRVFTSVFTSTVLEMLLELVGGLDLEVLSVGSEDGPGGLLKLGLPVGLHLNVVLGFGGW